MTGTLRDAFDDLATTVRPVDLTDRVAAGARRRRRRHVVAVSAATVTLGAVAFVAARPIADPARVVASPSAAPAGGTQYDAVWFEMGHNELRWYAVRPDGRRDELGRPPLGATTGDLSPDGRRLAYTGNDGVGIVTLDTGKKVEHDVRVTNDEGHSGTVTWSPDGRTIALVSGASVDGRTGVSSGFSLLDAETGRETRITHPHRNFGLSWSPDGNHIAVVSPTGTIDILTRTGSVVRQLMFRSFARLASNHAWSPDGTRLLVVLGPEDGGTYLAVVSATSASEHGRVSPSRYGYVWRDATHVACECTKGVVTERALDGGTVTRTLLTVDGSRRMGMVIRPAS